MLFRERKRAMDKNGNWGMRETKGRGGEQGRLEFRGEALVMVVEMERHVCPFW